jgi:hypothetical protein
MKNTFFLKILCVDFQVDPASITKGDVLGKGNLEKFTAVRGEAHLLL